jgi:hypothetical protein
MLFALKNTWPIKGTVLSHELLLRILGALPQNVGLRDTF